MRPATAAWATLIGAVGLGEALEGAEPTSRPAAVGTWTLTAGDHLAVEIDARTAEIAGIRVRGDGVTAGRGGVHFIDGRACRRLQPITVTEAARRGDSLEFGGTEPDGPLRWTCIWEPRPTFLRCRVVVDNRGEAQRWLEVRLGLPIDPTRGWQYWDGRNLPVPVQAHSRLLSAKAAPVLEEASCQRLESHYGLNFPMNAVWTAAAGLAVGVEPSAVHSYFAGGAEPGLSSADAIYYAVKLVIDPGRTEGVTFVLLAFDPGYGYRGALERYYEAFPEAYQPDLRTDRRTLEHCAVWGTAELFVGQAFLWEDARRLRLGWTWGTNARYAGLCYPDDGRCQSAEQANQAYWMFTNPNYKKPSWVRERVAQRGGLTPEEHRRYVREAFAGAADALAVACDITSQYCDKAVADQEFRDSLLRRPDGSHVDIPQLHIMYAWANAFGRRHATLADRAIVELQPAGVHLDNAVGYDPHYGPGAADSPGRAFDTRAGKVYSWEGVAQAMHMAAARKHTVRGRRVFVAANTVGTCFGAALCDVSLIESMAPFNDKERPWRGKHAQPGFEHYLAARFLLGAKPLVFCGPYPWEVKLPPEESQRPPAERQKAHTRAYEALNADYALFAYRVGAASIDYVLRPCANVRRHTDTVLRLARAGWQPVPAARADNPAVWVERFGRGVGGLVTVGNPTDAPVETRIVFDAGRWDGVVAVATADGSPITVAVTGGAAQATAVLPARTPVAWQVVGCLSPAPPEGTTIATTATDTATRLEVHCPGSWSGRLRTFRPADTVLESGRVAGRPCVVRYQPDRVEMDLTLACGRSVVEVEHAARYRIDAAASEFPFFSDGKCTAVIVVPPEARPAVRAAAGHLARYFQYWFARQQEPLSRPARLWQLARDEHQIPLLETHRASTNVHQIVINAPPLTEPEPDQPVRGSARVFKPDRGPQRLVIEAVSEADLDRTLRALLAVLDRRYGL